MKNRSIERWLLGGVVAIVACGAACSADGGLGPTDVCGAVGCAGLDDGGDGGDDDGSATSTADDDGSAPDDGDPGAAPPGGLPCDVLDVLARNCQDCHGDPTAAGAPMPLVDYDDLQLPALSDPARAVYEMVGDRVVDDVLPMPPGGAIEAADRQILLDWIDAGAPEDPTADCGAPVPDDDVPVGPDELPCDADFTLTAHGADAATGFAVPAQGADNLYMCFAFKAPFAASTQASAWAPIIDDERVVHHWILYRTKLPQIEGAASPCDVTLQVTTEFVAGWAPGGGNVVLPDDVGLDLGDPDDWYILQMHYNNTANYADVVDRSGVAFCTTDQPKPKTAGIVTLGSLGIAIPPGVQGADVTGVCGPWTTALWPEMHLLGSNPHMHELGRAMKSEVLHLDGTKEILTNVEHFDFNSQGMSMLEPEILVQPGDTITTTCTYDNPTALPVVFGERTSDEMCFNFVLAYPVDTLATRNCGIPL